MKLLLVICIFSQLVLFSSSADLKALLQEDKSNEEFLAESDWFELKDFYYKMNKLSNMEFDQNDPWFAEYQEDEAQANAAQNDEDRRDLQAEYAQFAQLARERLEALQEFRKIKMLEILNGLITGGEGEWIEHTPEYYNQNLKSRFKEIVHLFSGNKLYLQNDDHFYLFNYFGSNTPTSDLDYGLYILTVPRTEMVFFDELSKVDQTNTLIVEAAREFLGYLGRPNDLLQNLLDINGYPDMFVLYQYFFRMNSLNVMGGQLDWVFQNYFSNIMLRICLAASIHPYRQWLMSGQSDRISDQEELILKCYRLFMGVRNEYLKRNWQQAELVPEETRNLIIKDKKFIADESKDFDQFLLIGKLFQAYDNTYSSRKDSETFKMTIKKNSSPAYVLDMVKMDTKPKDVKYQSINYANFQSIFFIEKDEADQQLSLKTFTLPNQIYMTLISSSFSLASEAYCTIGALEFVKYQGRIENGDTVLTWDSLFEVFADNFGMILSHIAHDKDKLLVDIQYYQPVSDVFSKYLKRAMAFLRVRALNSFDVNIRRIFDGELSKEITDHWIYGYYTVIIDYSGNDAKQFCFDRLKEMSPQQRIDKILEDIFTFYKIVFHFLLDNFHVNDVIFKRQRRLLLD